MNHLGSSLKSAIILPHGRLGYFLLRQCGNDGSTIVGVFQPDGGVAALYSPNASSYLKTWENSSPSSP
jgi:hypothetical protein